jgi:phosphoglycolate phosphatase-like HAD superfamily hydrolase
MRLIAGEGRAGDAAAAVNAGVPSVLVLTAKGDRDPVQSRDGENRSWI